MIDASFALNNNIDEEGLVELGCTFYGAKAGAELGTFLVTVIAEEVACDLVTGAVSAVFPPAGAIVLSIGVFKLARIALRGSQFVRQNSQLCN